MRAYPVTTIEEIHFEILTCVDEYLFFLQTTKIFTVQYSVVVLQQVSNSFFIHITSFIPKRCVSK